MAAVTLKQSSVKPFARLHMQRRDADDLKFENSVNFGGQLNHKSDFGGFINPANYERSNILIRRSKGGFPKENDNWCLWVANEPTNQPLKVIVQDSRRFEEQDRCDCNGDLPNSVARPFEAERLWLGKIKRKSFCWTACGWCVWPEKIENNDWERMMMENENSKRWLLMTIGGPGGQASKRALWWTFEEDAESMVLSGWFCWVLWEEDEGGLWRWWIGMKKCRMELAQN